MMHRPWVLVALVLCLMLVSSQAKKGDDSGWNLPSSNNKRNNNKNKNNNGKKFDKDKKRFKKNNNNNNNNKKKSSSTEESSSTNFQTSLTFIPQQELADPKLMKLINSPWNDKEKKEKLQSRLNAFVREKLVDQDKVDQLTKRTRKEWEDMEITSSNQLVQGMAKILAGILSSPGFQKLLEDRDAQEDIRIFLMGVSLQIRNFLNDPARQKLLMNSDQWFAMFDKIKSWEGAPHEQVLEEFLDFMDRRDD